VCGWRISATRWSLLSVLGLPCQKSDAPSSPAWGVGLGRWVLRQDLKWQGLCRGQPFVHVSDQIRGTPRGIPRGAATRRPCLMVSRHPQRPGSLTPHRPDGDTIAIHRIWATARPCRRDGREPSPATWPSAHPSRSRLVGASGRHRASHLLRYRCLEAPRKHWPLVRSSVRHLRSGGLQSPRGR
jgi:hypothetical protein